MAHSVKEREIDHEVSILRLYFNFNFADKLFLLLSGVEDSSTSGKETNWK